MQPALPAVVRQWLPDRVGFATAVFTNGLIAGEIVPVSTTAIAGGFPQTRRCTSGYNLRELLAPQPHLGRLLAGSEGTLALFLELEVELDVRPAKREVAALTFATLRRALDAHRDAVLAALA